MKKRIGFKKKIVMTLLLMAIIITSMVIPGCIIEEDSSTEGETFTIVDDVGKSITIEKYPKRIVSLSPGITEILYSLGLGDKIVGVDAGSNYPATAAQKQVVFEYNMLHTENLTLLEPDVIFLNHELDLYSQWREKIYELGFPLIILDPEKVDDILDNIDLVGKATGQVENAKLLIDSLEKRIDEVESKGLENTNDTRPRVLYVIWFGGTDPGTGGGDPWVVGRNTYVDDMIGKCGGSNIITKVEGNNQVNLETIVSENPDVIFCSQNEVWPTQSRELILSDPIFSSTSAVKNNKVYDINADLTERPGPRLVDGLELMQELILSL